MSYHPFYGSCYAISGSRVTHASQLPMRFAILYLGNLLRKVRPSATLGVEPLTLVLLFDWLDALDLPALVAEPLQIFLPLFG
jgi:hypothetical protein